MIYRSNLTCPDLSPHFPMISKPRDWSLGHDVPSDPEFDPNCGWFTHDEAAILYAIAQSLRGDWVDIGSRCGWTMAHILAGGAMSCVGIDQGYLHQPLMARAERNLLKVIDPLGYDLYGLSSSQFFEVRTRYFDGFCIDGDHDAPVPLNDAIGAAACAKPTAAIVFHDFWGQPIRDAVTWLMERHWKARVYCTPNGLAVCWRGDYEPPVHQPDPPVKWKRVLEERAPGFDFGRCA